MKKTSCQGKSDSSPSRSKLVQLSSPVPTLASHLQLNRIQIQFRSNPESSFLQYDRGQAWFNLVQCRLTMIPVNLAQSGVQLIPVVSPVQSCPVLSSQTASFQSGRCSSEPNFSRGNRCSMINVSGCGNGAQHWVCLCCGGRQCSRIIGVHPREEDLPHRFHKLTETISFVKLERIFARVVMLLRFGYFWRDSENISISGGEYLSRAQVSARLRARKCWTTKLWEFHKWPKQVKTNYFVTFFCSKSHVVLL